MASTPKPRVYAEAAILVGALLGYGLFIWASRIPHGGILYFSLFDDAMISMRYARNLAEGAGLVWNPGGEPVEGYTNFLWTIWMALLHLAPVSEAKVSLLVMLSGVAVLIANLWVVVRLSEELSISSPIARSYVVAATAFCAPLIFWTLRGMEVGLVCLQVDVCLLLAIGLPRRFAVTKLLGIGLILSLGVLTRADFAVTAAAVAISVSFAVESRNRLRAVVVVLAPVAGVWLAHLGFRWVYYGEILPNTYYLKMTGLAPALRIQRGLDVLLTYTAPHLGALVLLGTAGVLFRDFRRNPGIRLLIPVIVAQLAYSIYVGGDAWEEFGLANRYLAVAVPSLIVLSAVTLQSIERGTSRSLRGAFLAAVLALVAWVPMNAPHFASWIADGPYYVALDRELTEKGLAVREQTPDDITISVTTAGAIPYFARRRAIDVLGKNDKVIAHLPHMSGALFIPGHSKWDASYSIAKLRPDLVVIGVGAGPKFYRQQGYVPAPAEIGVWMTPALAKRLKQNTSSIDDTMRPHPGVAPVTVPAVDRISTGANQRTREI